MAKTVLTFSEVEGKGWVSTFVAVNRREHIQISKSQDGNGVTYVQASTDGENFTTIFPPKSGRDILIPIEVPNDVIVRVVSTDQVSYAAVLSDIGVVEIPQPDPTQTYYKNAISDYDGNWYDAVIIGDLVVIKTNVRATHFADGTSLSSTGDALSYAYRNYESAPDGIEKRGLLYNGTVAKAKKFFFNGWHVISDDDFRYIENTISKSLGGDEISKEEERFGYFRFTNIEAASAISDTETFTQSSKPNTPNYSGATAKDTFGFSAVAAGYWNPENSGTYRDYNQFALFWTQTPKTGGMQQNFVRMIEYSQSGIQYSADTIAVYYSIRCVCDMKAEMFRQWYVNTYHTNEHIV